MIGKHVLSDLEIASLQIPTKLSWGHICFQETLKTPTSDVSLLKRRQLALFALRHKDATVVSESLQSALASLAPHTSVVDELETEIDPRIQEIMEQIYWAPGSMGSVLNDKKAIVSSLVFWKTVALPTIAVVVPLLAIVIPFFLLRYFHGVSLSAAEYMSKLREVLMKQVTIPPMLRAKHEADFLGHMFESAFLGLTLFTYASGIWSQVTASLHLRSIALTIREKGEAILQIHKTFVGILDTLRTLPARLQKALAPQLLDAEKIFSDISEIPFSSGCGYRVYGYVWNNRDSLQSMKRWLGMLDAQVSIARIPTIAFPCYNGTHLEIVDVYHPSLETRISNTASWSSVKSHAILTGPNRGGKSTLCRAIGLSILCAQTWGYAYASRMSFTPFTYIETALHPSDELGAMSLFEAEIEFAKSVLQKGRQGERIFVMMDEIFHSTNAADGLAASRVFLSQLYAIPTATSLISTHYKDLPTEWHDRVYAWAMEADEVDGVLQYTYKLIEGVSDKSSVMEILRERGLLEEKTSAAPIRD